MKPSLAFQYWSNRQRKVRTLLRHSLTIGLGLFSSALSGCTGPRSTLLPLASTLSAPEGYRVARVITHFHTPYSFDGCDSNGDPTSAKSLKCFEDIRTALCKNHLDALFLTDHLDSMTRRTIDELLLHQAGDTLITRAGTSESEVNLTAPCADGFQSRLFMGYEAGLMALGMNRQLATDADSRYTLYNQETSALRNQLQQEADAIVAVPHSEARTVDQIASIQPDALEVYNIHANLDPKIRSRYLALGAFDPIPDLVAYLIDPYRDLKPDYAFLHFLKISPVYAEKWHQLLARGLKITGIGGSDSHQNIFPQRAADGERLDSYRRMTRMMSFHALVPNLEGASIKTALKRGRGHLIIEGLGTPISLDFRAVQGSQIFLPGDSVALSNGSVRLQLTPPLPERTPAQLLRRSPRISLKLFKIGYSSEPATSDPATLLYDGETSEPTLQFTVTEPGAYRFAISMKPLHLEFELGDFARLAENEYPWIIGNPIYVTQTP